MPFSPKLSKSFKPFFARKRLAAIMPALLMGGALGTATHTPIANAQSAESIRKTYDIPAGSLEDALNAFARQARITLSFDPALVSGKRAAALKGSFTAREGLAVLLSGNSLEVIGSGNDSYTLRPTPAPAAMTLKTVSVRDTAILANTPEPKGFKARYQEGATKTSLDLRETPQAITVVTRDSIEARQARDLTSALELTAGVTASGDSTTGGPFAGRGLATGEAFVLRGQELNDMRDIRIDGFAVPTRTFDMAVFDRVEVIKGPSSMLYGQGSLGGFINVVRKKPQVERHASIAAQVSSWDTYRTELDVGGALRDDAIALGRLSAAYDDGKSFIDGVETKVLVVSPSVELNIGDNTRVQLDVLYQDEEFVPSHGIPLRPEGVKLKIPDISRSQFSGIPAEKKSSSDDMLTSVRIDQTLSDRWLATLLLQNSNQDFHRYFDGYAHGGLSATGDTGVYTDTALIERDTWSGELRLDGRFDAFEREHSLLAGVEKNHRKDRTAFGYQQIGTANIYADDFSSVEPFPGGAANLPFNRDNDTISSNKALYLQTVLSLSERTKLIVGARYDSSDQESEDNQTDETGDKKTDREFTKRVGLTHKFSKNITAYASYAESFNPITDVSRSGEILDPETGVGYEVGLKTEWFDAKLGATLAVFRQTLEDTPIPDPVDIDFSINGGKQRTDGVELEMTGSPLPGLIIGAAAAWFNGEYIDRSDPYYGMKPYAFVEDQYSVYASYQLQGGLLQGLGFGATVVHVGDRYLGYPGMSQWVEGLTPGEDEAVLEGYERVDFNVFYRGLPKWEFALQMRNAFDETYIERFRDIESNNYFGAPRAYLFRVKRDF